MLGRLILAALGFFVAALLAYVLVIVGTAVVWDLAGVVDRDGGGGMAVAFFFAPLAALVAGFFGVRAALAPPKNKE